MRLPLTTAFVPTVELPEESNDGNASSYFSTMDRAQRAPRPTASSSCWRENSYEKTACICTVNLCIYMEPCTYVFMFVGTSIPVFLFFIPEKCNVRITSFNTLFFPRDGPPSGMRVMEHKASAKLLSDRQGQTGG